MDANEVWNKIIPPFMAAGHYKIAVRLHTSSNETIFSYAVKFEIKSLDETDLSMLNMG